jgi:hypothetical protein
LFQRLVDRSEIHAADRQVDLQVDLGDLIPAALSLCHLYVRHVVTEGSSLADFDLVKVPLVYLGGCGFGLA